MFEDVAEEKVFKWGKMKPYLAWAGVGVFAAVLGIEGPLLWAGVKVGAAYKAKILC